MKVKYSKQFVHETKKLNGKLLRSTKAMINEVKAAKQLSDITDCKKLSGYNTIYRIRIGDRRAFFTFHIEIIDDTVFFRYLVPRGQAYSKKTSEALRMADNE